MPSTQRVLVDKLTPLLRDEAALAMARAYQAQFGALPGARALAVLCAQSALETGHWRACHWNNWGNAKAGADYSLVTFFGCSEILGRGALRREHWFHPPEPIEWPSRDAWVTRHPTSEPSVAQCRWRAYRTAAEGALRHLQLIGVDTNGDGYNRYGRAWDAALSGDPRGFAHELYAAGYYTASEGLYTSALVSLTTTYEAVSVSALDTASRAIVAQPPVEHEELTQLELEATVPVRDAQFAIAIRMLPLEITEEDRDAIRAARDAEIQEMW